MVKLTRDIGNLIILFVLNIIPIVNFIVLGYCAWILRLGDSISEPPKIRDYLKLFVDGLKIILAIIIYALIPILIVILSCPMLVFPPFIIHYTRFGMMGPGHMLFVGSMFLGLIFALIIGFLLSIVGAMGIIHMVKCDDFFKAFSFSEIFDRIRYVGWGKYLGWLIIMYILFLIVSSLNRIHWIIFSLANVFYLVFLFRSAHYIYGG